METTPCIKCGCLYDSNELNCPHCGHTNIWKVSNGKIKDENILRKLELEVQGLIERTPWKEIEYTVPGSLEKIIEVQGGLTYALKRILKGIEFIQKGKQNEDQESQKNQ